MNNKRSKYEQNYWQRVGEAAEEDAIVTGTDTGSRLVLVSLASGAVEIRLRTSLDDEEKQGLEEAEKAWDSFPRELEELFDSVHSERKLKVTFLTRVRLEECLQMSLRQGIFSSNFLLILTLENIKVDLLKQPFCKALSYQYCLESLELVGCTFTGNIVPLIASFKSLTRLKGLILDWSHFPNEHLAIWMRIFNEMKSLVWLELKDNDMQRIHWINLFRTISSNWRSNMTHTLFYGINFLGIEAIEWVRFLDDVIPAHPFTRRKLRK